MLLVLNRMLGVLNWMKKGVQPSKRTANFTAKTKASFYEVISVKVEAQLTHGEIAFRSAH